MRQMQLLEPLWQAKLLTHFRLSKSIDYRKMNAPVIEDLKMSLNPDVWQPHLDAIKNLLLKFNLESKKFIVIFPSSVWKTKQWTVEGFAQLAKQLETQKYNVVLMGSKVEYELCEVIANQLNRKINLAGKCTLWESLLVLSAAKLVVCNDSGSMHMGAFADVPTVAIFGPTVLTQGFRPWQNHATVVENNKINCRPCGKHGHKTCPLKHHDCMKTISSDLVFSACRSYI
jgi:heptosyltransferase-2